MRLGPEHLGPRGLMLLGAAGVLGVALAVHGYGKGVVVASGTAGVVSASQPSATTATTTPSTTTPPSKAAGSTTTSTSAAPRAQKLGPALASTQYASYAYQVYPGSLSSQAQLALTGFTVHVTPGPTTITVKVSATGSAPQSSNYPLGDKVYFVETTLGDDSGVSDYNFGDDGILVTNAAGRIVE